MSSTRHQDWTTGAPKWAAIVVLGAASIGGISWAMGRDGRNWRAPALTTVTNTSTTGARSQAGAPEHPVAGLSASGSASPKSDIPSAASIRKLINLNTADAAELELLPGIGPAMAKRIIDYRATRGAFRRVEDLDAVKGIGLRILERVKGLVVVE